MYPELGALAGPRPVPAAVSGVPIEAARLVRAVGRRKRALVIAGIAGVALGVGASRLVDPSYRATTLLVWDDPAAVDPTTVDRKIRTAVDEVKMPATLNEVRSRLGLASSLDALAAKIEVRTAVGSDLVHIGAVGASGREAATLADEVARAFLAERALQVRRLARSHADEIGRQIETTTKALAVARRERDRFRLEHGVVDLPSERTIAVEQRALLATDSERARADAGVERARSGDLALATRGLPAITVLTENESRPDVRRLAEAENELASLRGGLTEDSPRLQVKQAEVEALRLRAKRSDLVVRAERIIGRNPIRDFLDQNRADAAARASAAERRHDAYRELADHAKRRVEELNLLEGEAAELDNKVLSIETRLGGLRRDLQAALERAEVGGADLHVMAGASVPVRPFASKRRTIAIAIPVLVVMLVALVLLIRALRGLRAMTPRELAYWSGYPVLVAGDRLSDAAEVEGMAGELTILLAHAEGETLIVAASAHERDAAAALTSRLETEAVSDRSTGARGRRFVCWSEAATGAALRRRARAAARVLVVVAAGVHKPWTLKQLSAQIGRTAGLALVVIEVGTELALVVDRVGNAESVISSTTRQHLER